VASDCDGVVIFLGLSEADESDGFDRTHLELLAAQLAAPSRCPFAVVASITGAR
jgi:hypothetical protein